ncbi:MAG: competence protein ComEC family protein [Phascolarctobacterium sp.]|nr:competence protein ComEC family protein [Phascolarctobacterium sp.]
MTSFIYALGLFFLGNYIGLFLDFLYSFHNILLLPAVSLIIFSLKNRNKYLFTYSVCAVFLLIGVWNGVRVGPSAAMKLRPYWRKNVIVNGTVEPLSWKEKDGLQTFVLKVRDMELEAGKVEYRQSIRVTVGAKTKLVDKQVKLSGKLHELVGFRNPGSFDSKTYYKVQGISGRLAKSKLIHYSVNNSFVTKLALLNIELRRKLDECMPARLSHLLGGMLLGGSGLEDDSREIFLDNGLSHLLSVSGTHLVLLAGLLGILFKPLPEKCQKLLIVIFLGVYALLCGLKAPIVRAFVMLFVILFGGNGAEKGRLLGLAGVLLLLFKPEWILDVGFQLSFGASLGLIYLSPKLKNCFDLFLPEIIAETVSVTMGVQLITLPVVINNFHQISLISIISNVILLPILEMTSLLTLCGLLLAYCFNAYGLLKISSFFIDQVLVQANILRSLPFSTIAIASLPPWSYGLYYGILVLWLDKGFIKNLENQERKQYLAGLSAIFVAAFLWSNFLPKPFAVYFLDIVLQTPIQSNRLKL